MEKKQTRTKKCPSCKRTLDISLYGSYWRSEDQLTYKCKNCNNQYRRVSYTKSPRANEKTSNAGRPLLDDSDPTQFLYNLNNHNKMHLTYIQRHRAFRWPSFPYKRLIRLYHVDTEKSYSLRIFLKAPELTEFKIYDSALTHDKLIVGFSYGCGLNERIISHIVRELSEACLRIMW